MKSLEERLAAAWERSREGIQQRAAVIARAAAAGGDLAGELREMAAGEAHRLAGSLGTFGLPAGSEVARRLETILQNPPDPVADDELSELSRRLRALIEAGPGAVVEAETRERPALLVLLGDADLRGAVADGAPTLGMRGRVFTDSPAALDWLGSRRPAMAVVDLDLPEGKAGPEDVIDTITARSPESPILVLSESAEIEDRVRLAHSGNCAFLQKPAQPSEILDAVGDLFAREPDGQEIVLAVDDDPLILEALGQYLDGRFRLVPVQDPLEFWEVLDEVAPTVVMLDVDMPGVSGIELCRVIRSDQRWRGLPILFLTAHRDAKTIQEMFEAGADDYVNKPIIGAELLTRLANRVERAQLYRRLAETDGLTGASMRRQSVRVLGRYIRLARRQNRPLSVAILDVDHFKSVNDRFGHNVGDRVLSRVGGLLVDTFRVEDLVARWGGEEFLVGMYGTAREDAATRVRAILKEVRGIVFQDDTGGEFSITISGGVAELWDESATLDDLIRSADDALYMAKDTGRDRVIVAGDEHAGSGEAR